MPQARLSAQSGHTNGTGRSGTGPYRPSAPTAQTQTQGINRNRFTRAGFTSNDGHSALENRSQAHER